jgi:hypothetical protein
MSPLRRYSSWLLLGVLLFVVALLSVISNGPGEPDTPLSLDSASPGGALALKLWLTRIGYTVRRQTSYGLPSSGSTLLVLEPEREPARDEVAALRQWARGGGRLVIVSDEMQGLLSAFGLHPGVASSAPVHVTQPVLLRPQTVRLEGSASVLARHRAAPGDGAGTTSGTVLTRRRLGKGEVWELTAPGLLDNGDIGKAQNRRLALNLAGEPGPIVVDQPGPVQAAGGGGDWLSGTAWGIAVIFTLAVLLLFRWLGGWRLGPPIVPFSERRRPAVEYVLSLAVLLRRAQRRADVLAIYQRELRDRLRRRFGTDQPDELPRDVADRVRPLLQPPSGLSEDDLIRQAEAIVRCEEALKERV